ncbi:hypothetical protein [Treponema brennaborense]|uniref:SH3 type 3 domain protein n=1 Tax=Treponema brennaborense (strain DSM 12168 / CIP 105900 / DD5/3) TaxID=906968 RepID=F4LK46_TREBD|nr:hypothetical protein [Treponema brennaborense]AEE17508.1 hypothetical protein Trebr_2093 [Treponema brennaborense DSM 12168]
MEKSAINRRFGFRIRLLTAAACLCAAIPSIRAQTPSDFRNLSVTPNGSWFFTGSECGFSLEIPGVPPSQVQASVQRLPEGVSFISLHKDELISEQVRGTSVRVWFSIMKSGRIRLPPLSVRISGRTYAVPFEEVEVYEDPALIKPELSLEFRAADGQLLPPDSRGVLSMRAAEVLTLSVSVRFAANLTDFSWKLPRDSLFSEVQRYPFSRSRNGSGTFSPDWDAVADFEWTPLVAGTYALPDITVTVVSFGGYRMTLPLPSYTVNVLPSAASNTSAASGSAPAAVPDLFAAAFTARPGETVAETDAYRTADAQGAALLAELRTAERYALPRPGFRNERLRSEASYGITASENEPSVPAAILIAVCAAVCGAGSVVFALFGKKAVCACGAALCALLLTCGGIYASRLWADTGVFAGGLVRAVPENSVSGAYAFAAGSRVEILSEAGKWLYIQTDTNGGWVPETHVFRIGGRHTSKGAAAEGE